MSEHEKAEGDNQMAYLAALAHDCSADIAAAKAEGERIGYEAAMRDAAAFEANPSGKTIAKLPHLARLLATFREAAERAEAGGYERGKAGCVP